jgi:hypothetical protein
LAGFCRVPLNKRGWMACIWWARTNRDLQPSKDFAKTLRLKVLLTFVCFSRHSVSSCAKVDM